MNDGSAEQSAPPPKTTRDWGDGTGACMNDIVRTKVSKREKISEYAYLGFVGLGPLGTSLLEDAGVESFWIRILLFLLLMTIVFTFLAFLGVRAGRQRLTTDWDNGISSCAVRFPSSTPGSLRDLWDEGAARVSDDGLVFQPQHGPFLAKPAGKKRHFGRFAVLGAVEMTGKKPRVWSRGWSARELQTDAGKIHLAASSKSWALIDERSNREPHGSL
jgi:hypothetical protein